MLSGAVGCLTVNLITQLDEALRELTKTTTGQCSILSLMPYAQFLGLLAFYVRLILLSPVVHWHAPSKEGLQLYKMLTVVEIAGRLAAGSGGVSRRA